MSIEAISPNKDTTETQVEFTPEAKTALGNLASGVITMLKEPHSPYQRPKIDNSREISDTFKGIFKLDNVQDISMWGRVVKDSHGKDQYPNLVRLYQALEEIVIQCNDELHQSKHGASDVLPESEDSTEKPETVDVLTVKYNDLRRMLYYMLNKEVDNEFLDKLIYELLADKARFISFPDLEHVNFDGINDVGRGPFSHIDHQNKSPFGFDLG